ncbi:toll/interleukin-1 receptor domain-containing protein [Alkalihalobacillus sp. FSL R5-0424]
MSLNETNLKRATTKDVHLQTKLISARKKRDDIANRILKISKKKNMTKTDLRNLGRYNKDLTKYDKDITQLLEDINKNTINLNNYKMKMTKEQEKMMTNLTKSLKNQTSINEIYTDSNTLIAQKLSDLSIDVKNVTQEKELINYDVFLSHSSLDKEAFISDFSKKLSDMGLEVFEDVKVFKIGQSQTDMMNMGILNSRFVVVFLSANFIKSGWSDYEFKSFLNREINEERIVILPIWHGVSVEEVRQYNPYLVDKFALNTQKFSLDEIAEHINQVVIESKEGQ